MFVELGGFRQTCEFEHGLYINPGRWRIPYHHRAVLDYCKRLGVALEPFIQLNHNAFLHAASAFGGVPQRIRDVKTDFQGQISELLAKATQQGKLDEAVSKEDREILLQALKSWGALDSNYAYKANLISADFRGYAKGPGGGLGAAPVPGEVINLPEILKSRVWRYLQYFSLHTFQSTMFHRRHHSVRREGDPDTTGRSRRHGYLYELQGTSDGTRDTATGQGRLVRLHDPALHPEPTSGRRERCHEGGH